MKASRSWTRLAGAAVLLLAIVVGLEYGRSRPALGPPELVAGRHDEHRERPGGRDPKVDADEDTVPAATQGLEFEAPSVVLMDAATGKVLAEKNPHERRPIASVTKVMTLVLAFEAMEQGRIDWDDKVVVSPYAAEYATGTHIFLHEGEVISVRNLLYAVAVGSANDASVALAEHVAGSEERFVQLMNAKAKALGMNNTNYVDSHGLSLDGYSTAYDQALLAREAARYPELLKLTSIFYMEDTPEPREVRGRRVQVELLNRNRLLLGYSGLDGLKTGFTSQANFCVVATARRGDTRMVAVVLGHPSSSGRNREAAKLLNHGFANWVSLPVVKRGDVVGSVRVHRGARETVPAVAAEDMAVLVERGRQEEVERRVVLEERLVAPVARGQRLGEIVVGLAGEEPQRVALVAAEEVRALGYVGLVWRVMQHLFRGGP